MQVRRWDETLATGVMLAVAALPFIVLFPEPPHFGRAAMGLLATFIIPATMGTGYRARPVRRTRIMRRAALVLAVTVASIVLRIMLSGHITDVPTIDGLAWLFGLEGEDIDDSVTCEAWLEIWLACAATVVVPAVIYRINRRTRSKAAPPGPWNELMSAPRWNGATILLWLVGLAALGGAVVQGHRTASFLAGCVRVTGTIVDPQSHPIIEFTSYDGAVVRFTQNGSISRDKGEAVPVAYQTQDPAGTARADTFWADWSDVLGFAWIGLGFTLAPFFGFRGEFRAGRW